MNKPLDFEHVAVDARTEVLRVNGPLDAKHAPLLIEHCVPAREAGRNLVLNLAGVPFIASSGIGALLALVEEYRDAAGTIRIAAASPAVESVITLLNLDRFLTMDASEQDAITALAA
jgi:anti-sigma B factor antagonist